MEGKRCYLCNRPISDLHNHYGLVCQNKLREIININKVSSIKNERGLDFRIQFINAKWFINERARKLLTDRYMTYSILKKIDLSSTKKTVTALEKDIKSINNKTDASKLESYLLTLNEAFEIYELYLRVKDLIEQTKKFKEFNDEKQVKELQSIPWETVMLALNSYYEKKPYLSETIQEMQKNMWEIFASIAKFRYPNGANCLKYSLQENPQDIYINDPRDIMIMTIKENQQFISLIKKITSMEKNEEIKHEGDLIFTNIDLFLALYHTDIVVTGKKEQNKWKLHILIDDVYDFTNFKEIDDYVKEGIIKGIVGSTLYNIAMVSVATNVMNTYKIKIEFDYEMEV